MVIGLPAEGDGQHPLVALEVGHDDVGDAEDLALRHLVGAHLLGCRRPSVHRWSRSSADRCRHRECRVRRRVRPARLPAALARGLLALPAALGTPLLRRRRSPWHPPGLRALRVLLDGGGPGLLRGAAAPSGRTSANQASSSASSAASTASSHFGRMGSWTNSPSSGSARSVRAGLLRPLPRPAVAMTSNGQVTDEPNQMSLRVRTRRPDLGGLAGLQARRRRGEAERAGPRRPGRP